VIDLSIIIVNWNVAGYLRGCLHSILAAPVRVVAPATEAPAPAAIPSVEIIVVDSGSTDESPALLRAHPQVQSFLLSQNVGFTRANNIALAAARGRHLLLLNPDTEIVGDALATLVRYLDAHPDVGIVGPHTLNSDGTTQPSRRRFHTFATVLFSLKQNGRTVRAVPPQIEQHYYLSHEPERALVEVDWVNGSALMARRAVYEQIGGLDERFVMCYEEVDWCRRAKLAGWRVVYVGTAQILHHEGKSSAQAPQHRRLHYRRSKLLYVRKHYGVLAAAALHLGLIADERWPWAIARAGRRSGVVSAARTAAPARAAAAAGQISHDER